METTDSRRVAQALWRGAVLGTMRQRGMLRGEAVPKAEAVIFGGRIIYILDLQRLGGLSYEAVCDERFRRQLEAATGGRRVTITADGGLAIQIGLELASAAPAARRWPARVELPESVPAGLAYGWPFGVDHGGRAVWRDLLETSHLLIGAKTGGGKSTMLNTGLVALLRRHGPETLRLALIDGKQGMELSGYDGMPHLVRPVARAAGAAGELVRWLAGEVDRRALVMTAAGARKLVDYNRGRAAEGRLPLLLAVVDEVTNLTLDWGGTAAPEAQAIVHVMNAGRAVGVLVVLATQHPRADVLDTLARGNAGVRVCGPVDEPAQARAILGTVPKGTEFPEQAGRCLVRGLARGLVELQGYTVSDAEIAAVVRDLRSTVVSGDPGADLSAEARGLLEYCLAECAGVYHQQNLIRAGARGLAERAIKKATSELRGRGLIARGAVTEPYRVTDLARQLLGAVPRADVLPGAAPHAPASAGPRVAWPAGHGREIEVVLAPE